MGLLTGKGQAVKEAVQKEKVDLKEAYIRLKKEGESVLVRLLGTEDYVSFKSHGDFSKKIYGTPCLVPNGEVCPFCVAKAKGGKEWEALYAKERVVFAMAVVETGELKLLDLSTAQARKLIADIEEYADEITAGEIAFNLVRTGADMSTAYQLKPLTAKKFTAIADKFNVFKGVAVEDSFFEDRVVAKSQPYMVKLLIDAGFNAGKYFSVELVAQAMEQGQDSDTATHEYSDTDCSVPTEDTDDDDVI